MTPRIVHSLADVTAAAWNNLDLGGNPLLRHEFLYTLEHTSCAAAETGWQTHHLILEDAGGYLVGALPLYQKTHSWGEFVFDWSWASAYSHLGQNYYPKLLSMVPFTPATMPRLLTITTDTAQRRKIQLALVDGLLAAIHDSKLSSAHVLFTTVEEQRLLEEKGFIARCDCQFHWHNCGFKTFDDFIATFRADKRKKALRERRRVAEAGITFATYSGGEMTAERWRQAMRFSEGTFASHGHEHYLNVDFLCAAANALPEAFMVKFAMQDQRPVAAAIFFQSEDTLYGRYWGASAEFHSLHFETCYFQGIEYCIARGLQSFEPGTQGEHKIARGFTPAKTWSAHFIADPRIARAIRSHCEQERLAVDRYIDSVNEHLPFHRDHSPADFSSDPRP